MIRAGDCRSSGSRPWRRSVADPPPTPLSLPERLRRLTPARVQLGRFGTAQPTRALLEFSLAHARARDAVHEELASGELLDALAGQRTIEVHSCAVDRATFLRRPDLGRSLHANDVEKLVRKGTDLAIVLADGLSAQAVRKSAAAVALAMIDDLNGWRIAPLVIARQARVAIGDEIGEALGSSAVVVLIGERPGLTAPDSLGAYVTWGPRKGRVDSERNCVSNIRSPQGMSPATAADQIVKLLRAARLEGRTGLSLKVRAGPDPTRIHPSQT